MKDEEAINFVQYTGPDDSAEQAATVTDSVLLAKSSKGKCFSRGRGKNAARLVLSDDSPDDLFLCSFANDGNQEAFARLMRRYQGFVVATAIRRGLTRDLAEDVSQEVFAVLSEKARSLISHPSIAGWLHRATMYEAAKALQADTRRNHRDAEWTALLQVSRVPHSAAVDSTLQLLDEALDELSAPDRDILILHYLQELPYATLAAQLRISEVAVRQRVSRALGRLESRLVGRGLPAGTAASLLAAAALHQGTAAAVSVAAINVAACGVAGASFWSTVASSLSSGVAKAGVLAKVAAVPVLVIGLGSIQDTLSPELHRSATVEVAMGASIEERSPSAGGSPRRQVQAAMVGFASPPIAAGQLPANSMLAPRAAEQAAAAQAAQKPAVRVGGDRTNLSRGGAVSRGLVERDAPVEPPASLDAMIQSIGLPAVLDRLRAVELVPEEAAEVYTDLLSEVLNLTPSEGGLIESLLEDHFRTLNDAAVAGRPASNTVLSSWKAVREPLMEEVIDDVSATLAEVAPELGQAEVAETVEEVLTIPDKLVHELDEPTESAVSSLVPDALEAALGSLPNTSPLRPRTSR